MPKMGLGEMGLGELGLGEMGGHRINSLYRHDFCVLLVASPTVKRKRLLVRPDVNPMCLVCLSVCREGAGIEDQGQRSRSTANPNPNPSPNPTPTITLYQMPNVPNPTPNPKTLRRLV